MQEILIYSTYNGKDELIKVIEQIRELVREVDIEIDDANVHFQVIENIGITQYDEKLYEGQITLQLQAFDY